MAYLIFVVAAGVLVGLLAPGRLTYAFDHATLYLFLPLLLFEAAWNLNYRAMRRNWASIATLAGPGVLLTATIIAAGLVVVHVPFGVALLVGAILGATDPIAVVAIFRRVRVPLMLATIVESESLLNDAVAVVLYRAVLLVVVSGASIGSVGWVTLTSLLGSAAGIGLGIAIAFAVAVVLRNRRAAELQVAGTLVCAYGSYFLAEHFGASGIFATVAGGIALRVFERSWITLDIVDEVGHVWDFGAKIANVLVFFLVGAALDVKQVAHHPAFVIATLVGVAVARGVLTATLLPTSFPKAWLGVIGVAAMRGALSLALAIALPPQIPYRQAIIEAVFAVSLATLFVSGITVPRAVDGAARRR